MMKPTLLYSTAMRLATMTTFFILVYLFACFWWDPKGFFSYDADMLMYPQVAVNLIHQHGNFFDWRFTNVFFLFPDLLICLVLALFTKNIVVIAFCYAIIQISALMLISRTIVNRVTETSQAKGVVTLMVLSLLWLLAHSQQIRLLHSIIFPAIHVGTMLMMLVSLFLLVKIMQGSSKKIVLLFSLIFFLTAISDPLFLADFAVPLAVSLSVAWMARRLSWRHYYRLILLVSVLILASWGFYHYGPLPVTPIKFEIHAFNIPTFLKMWDVIRTEIAHSPFVGNLWVLFVLFAPFSLISDRKKSASNFVLLTLLFQVIVGLFFFAFSCPTGPFVMPLRYLQPIIVLPVLVGLPILVTKHYPKSALPPSGGRYFLVLLFFVISAFMMPHPPLRWYEKIHYYPKAIACLDNQAQVYGLQDGIAGYWSIRPITLFSRRGLRISAVTARELTPFIWNNSYADYRNRQFNFVIINDRKKDVYQPQAERWLGVPDGHFICGDYLVKIYRHGQIDQFLAKHPPKAFGTPLYRTWVKRGVPIPKTAKTHDQYPSLWRTIKQKL